jgi:hypothetical protein
MRQSIGERLGSDEAAAWAALAANLAVLPGLGSLTAGRRVGWLQAALALSGGIVSLAWLAGFVREWIRLGAFPLDGGPDLSSGLAGVGAFGVAWLWSLATSLDLVRRARSR